MEHVYAIENIIMDVLFIGRICYGFLSFQIAYTHESLHSALMQTLQPLLSITPGQKMQLRRGQLSPDNQIPAHACSCTCLQLHMPAAVHREIEKDIYTKPHYSSGLKGSGCGLKGMVVAERGSRDPVQGLIMWSINTTTLYRE